MEMENETENSTLLQKMYLKSCDIMDNTLEILASWEIGQSMLKQCDKCLWIVEKSALWSVPFSSYSKNKESETNGVFGKPAPLVRPLPWVLFLPMLLTLRLIQMSLNLRVFMGMDSIKPTTIVKFLQTKRRKIRALKFRGIRRMEHKKQSEQTYTDKISSWKNRFYKTSSGVMCFNYSHNDSSDKMGARENSSEALVVEHSENKRKYDDIDVHSDDETLPEIIDKFAECDSDEDPDYVPVETQSDDESMSEGEDEPACTTKTVLKRPSSRTSITNEVIEEECEDSDSSTVSVDSTKETNKKIESPHPKSPIKEPEPKENNKNTISEQHLDAVTSDEYYSPQNSMCPSPEPKKEFNNTNITKIDLSEPPNSDPKLSSETMITTEKNQVQKNISQNGSNNAQRKSNLDENTTPSNNYKAHGKKGKKRRNFNILHRKRK